MSPAPVVSEVTLDHLRRGHAAIYEKARGTTPSRRSAMEIESLHDVAHFNKVGGSGGLPAHIHAAMSGVCEAALHEECVMTECECPCGHEGPA